MEIGRRAANYKCVDGKIQTREEVAKDIGRIIEEDETGEAFALRVIPPTYSKPEVGGALPDSFLWSGDKLTDEKSGNTSGLSVEDERDRKRSVDLAIGKAHKFYDGDYVVLMRGNPSQMAAHNIDENEVVIEGPKVVHLET